MAAAGHGVEGGGLSLDVLTLFSYPLHPPGKPERARTEHLPNITVPTVFTHGTADPFGSIDELRPAAALIPAPTTIVEVTGARHDLDCWIAVRRMVPATTWPPRRSTCRGPLWTRRSNCSADLAGTCGTVYA